MSKIINFEDQMRRFYDFTATCECGNNEFHILVDKLGASWNKILGTRCTKCGDIIKWQEAKKT